MPTPILADTVRAMQREQAPTIDQLAAMIIANSANSKRDEARGKQFKPTAEPKYARWSSDQVIFGPRSERTDQPTAGDVIRAFTPEISAQEFDVDAFAEDVKKRESRGSGGYKAYNASTKAMGAYQFTPIRLKELGYMDKKGNWTGKRGIKSVEDFLNSPEKQDAIFKTEHVPALREDARRLGTIKYVGQPWSGLGTVSEEGIVRGAHLGGSTGVRRFFEKGVDAKDSNQTAISDYIFK